MQQKMPLLPSCASAGYSPLEGDAKYGGEAALPEAHTLNDEVEDGAVSQKKGAEEEMARRYHNGPSPIRRIR